MFEQAFKKIDAELRKDAGLSTELDYVEQSSWILFLKYLDDLEQEKTKKAELAGEIHRPILKKDYRWKQWAAPKSSDGTLNTSEMKTGNDLLDFVNKKLFPYLKDFKRQGATSSSTIEHKISEIFDEITNKVRSGYILHNVIKTVDTLRFLRKKEKHELSHLYESKIERMGNAGRNGGEYYTPRALIRAMIQVIQPKTGERIYDGAAGSAGFLCEAYNYLRRQPDLTTSQLKTLQRKTFYGKEKKPLPFVIGIMNMILHGIETPNIIRTDTLAESIHDLQEKDRYEIILANPPFGGNKPSREVQQNFPIKTGEPAFLFLQHFIKSLKAGGRAAIVIKNTFLSNTDNASKSLRNELLTSCKLHTILDMPGGTFQGAGVKTVVLFFKKGEPTQKIWYYQLSPGRNLGKTNPLNDKDLAEFVKLQKTSKTSKNSWSVNSADLDKATFDLSVRNPNQDERAQSRAPEVILGEIAALDKESSKSMGSIEKLLKR